jgi:uncharacterized membrane protein YhhN
MDHRRTSVPLTFSLLPLILLSAALTIYGSMAGRSTLVYIFKPLTTALIMLLAALIPVNPDGRYRLAVIAGLVCSLVGDVFLMLPSDRFIAGVAAFLAAHVAYLIAFTTFVSLAAVPVALAAVAVVVAVILFTLWGSLPQRMRPALLAYAVILGAMTAQSLTQAMILGSLAAVYAAVGGALFLASDSILVTNRFAKPFRLAPLLVLGTYYAAQTLIALSVAITGP